MIKLFNYYTEDEKNKAIVKNEVSIDEALFKSGTLSKAIDTKKQTYENLSSRDNISDPKYDIYCARREIWQDLMSSYLDIRNFMAGEIVSQENFFKIYNQLSMSTVENSNEQIKKLELLAQEIVHQFSDTLNKGIGAAKPEYIEETAKRLKHIYYGERKLVAFDQEAEKYSQMLFNCISIKPVATYPIDGVNELKSFFGLDSNEPNYYESDKIRKIGTFKGQY